MIALITYYHSHLYHCEILIIDKLSLLYHEFTTNPHSTGYEWFAEHTSTGLTTVVHHKFKNIMYNLVSHRCVNNH